jgi:rfaE bifunctional protein kinase chain/domain
LINISAPKVKQLISNFKQKRILVIGDLMIDEYLIGNVIRLSPEAPVPIIEIKDENVSFGGAANVALNVSTLGSEPIIVGIIGKDRMGDLFIDMMYKNNMITEGIVRIKNRPTTVKTRVIGHSQHIARVDREHSTYLSGENETQILKRIAEFIPKVDGVIIQDYNKGVLTERVIASVIELTQRFGKLITVDPKFINFLKYKNVSVFKPNIKETEEALALKIACEEDLINAGKKLMDEINPDCLLITRGPSGMILFESDGSITNIATRARKISDVSGAGDTVISTLTVSLVAGATHKEAATLANYAAGIVCEEIGIVPIDINILQKVCLGSSIQ